VWNYALIEGSQLTDDCLDCARPPIVAPMRGGFQLRLVEESPLFSRYAVQNISFATSIPLVTTQVAGHGTYRVGGEVALVQEMFLELLIDDGVTRKLCFLTNDNGGIERFWPMLKIHLDQMNGTAAQTYRLDLAAAPLQEIWLSTGQGFHPGVQAPYTNYVTPGDLISSAGRIVKRNHELTALLGFMPVVPDLGLDAADILPGGEIAFRWSRTCSANHSARSMRAMWFQPRASPAPLRGPHWCLRSRTSASGPGLGCAARGGRRQRRNLLLDRARLFSRNAGADNPPRRPALQSGHNRQDQ
jgi:hypothetical protein